MVPGGFFSEVQSIHFRPPIGASYRRHKEGDGNGSGNFKEEREDMPRMQKSESDKTNSQRVFEGVQFLCKRQC